MQADETSRASRKKMKPKLHTDNLLPQDEERDWTNHLPESWRKRNQEREEAENKMKQLSIAQPSSPLSSESVTLETPQPEPDYARFVPEPEMKENHQPRETSSGQAVSSESAITPDPSESRPPRPQPSWIRKLPNYVRKNLVAKQVAKNRWLEAEEEPWEPRPKGSKKKNISTNSRMESLATEAFASAQPRTSFGTPAFLHKIRPVDHASPRMETVRKSIAIETVQPRVRWQLLVQPYRWLQYNGCAIFDTCALRRMLDVLTEAVRNKIMIVIPRVTHYELEHQTRNGVFESINVMQKLAEMRADPESAKYLHYELHDETRIRPPSFEPRKTWTTAADNNDDLILQCALRVKAEVLSISEHLKIYSDSIWFVTNDHTLADIASKEKDPIAVKTSWTFLDTIEEQAELRRWRTNRFGYFGELPGEIQVQPSFRLEYQFLRSTTPFVPHSSFAGQNYFTRY